MTRREMFQRTVGVVALALFGRQSAEPFREYAMNTSDYIDHLGVRHVWDNATDGYRQELAGLL